MSFLKVVDSANEDPNDRLRKVRYLYDHMEDTCNALFKPGQFISVNERMIKSKGRFLFKQYLPKPEKWEFRCLLLVMPRLQCSSTSTSTLEKMRPTTKG